MKTINLFSIFIMMVLHYSQGIASCFTSASRFSTGHIQDHLILSPKIVDGRSHYVTADLKQAHCAPHEFTKKLKTEYEKTYNKQVYVNFLIACGYLEIPKGTPHNYLLSQDQSIKSMQYNNARNHATEKFSSKTMQEKLQSEHPNIKKLPQDLFTLYATYDNQYKICLTHNVEKLLIYELACAQDRGIQYQYLNLLCKQGHLSKVVHASQAARQKYIYEQRPLKKITQDQLQIDSDMITARNHLPKIEDIDVL